MDDGLGSTTPIKSRRVMETREPRRRLTRKEKGKNKVSTSGTDRRESDRHESDSEDSGDETSK